MSERRSGRSRKQVDYTKFEVDNDDDFADPTPPPPKKKKTSEKTEGRKEKEKSPKVISSSRSSGKKGRLPLDEKLYERDLQAALEMSLLASQSEEDETDKDSNVINSHAVLHSTPLEESDHALSKTEMPDESQSIMPSAIPHGVAADNDIEFLGSVACSDSDSPSRKQRASTRKKTYKFDKDDSSESEDFSDGGSESDSDFNDADSDFDDCKVKSKSKKNVKAAPKITKPAAAAGKNHQSAAKRENKAGSTRVTPTPKTTVRSTTSAGVKSSGGSETRVSSSVTSKPACNRLPSAPHKTPAWTPPGRSDGTNSSSSSSVSLKSPSSGLRLGLSRHAHIKPLHPSLKVS